MYHPANQPHFNLTIEGVEHDLQVLAFKGEEALNCGDSLSVGGQHLLLCAAGIFSCVPVQPGGAPIPGTPARPLLPDVSGMPGTSHASTSLLPVPRSHRARYRLLDRQASEPLAGVAYTLRHADPENLTLDYSAANPEGN